MRKLFAFIFFVVFVASIIILVTASPILTIDLSGKKTFPLGTLITWSGIIALPLFLYFVISAFQNPKNKIDKVFKWIFICLIILSVLWGFLGFILAGNWAYTFSDSATGFRGSVPAGFWFWRFSFIIVLLPVLRLLVFFLVCFFIKVYRKR